MEAEHDYLIEAEASLHSTSSKEQVLLRGSAIQWMVQEWLESCRLRPDPGPCRGRLPRYYFLPRCHLVQWQSFFFSQNLIQLSRTSKCIQFPWGGCGGNANNFISASQCQAACLASTTAQANPVSAATMQEHPLIKVSQDSLGRNPFHTSLNAVSLRGQGRDSAVCHMQPEAGPCDQRLTRLPPELCL